MNELQNIDGFNAKIYGTAENPLFLAKDIADMLEIKNNRDMLNNVDEDEKLMSLVSTSGQNRNMWFLTEDGLYEVLMTSRKPQAKVFKKKVKENWTKVQKNKIKDIKTIKVFLQPENSCAYYTINDEGNDSYKIEL